MKISRRHTLLFLIPLAFTYAAEPLEKNRFEYAVEENGPNRRSPLEAPSDQNSSIPTLQEEWVRARGHFLRTLDHGAPTNLHRLLQTERHPTLTQKALSTAYSKLKKNVVPPNGARLAKEVFYLHILEFSAGLEYLRPKFVERLVSDYAALTQKKLENSATIANVRILSMPYAPTNPIELMEEIESHKSVGKSSHVPLGRAVAILDTYVHTTNAFLTGKSKAISKLFYTSKRIQLDSESTRLPPADQKALREIELSEQKQEHLRKLLTAFMAEEKRDNLFLATVP